MSERRAGARTLTRRHHLGRSRSGHAGWCSAPTERGRRPCALASGRMHPYPGRGGRPRGGAGGRRRSSSRARASAWPRRTLGLTPSRRRGSYIPSSSPPPYGVVGRWRESYAHPRPPPSSDCSRRSAPTTLPTVASHCPSEEPSLSRSPRARDRPPGAPAARRARRRARPRRREDLVSPAGWAFAADVEALALAW